MKGENSWESWWDEEQVCHLVVIISILCIISFISTIFLKKIMLISSSSHFLLSASS